MEGQVQPFRTGDIAAALAWWRDAGVDLDFTDDPVRWLADKDDAALAAPPAPALPAAYVAPRRAEPETVASAVRIGGDRSAWPADLAAFAPWWLAEPTLDGGQVRGRVPPRGPAGAPVMVLVPAPGPAETELLTQGAEASLLAAMLQAMGIAPEQAYLASALPRHMALPDWDSLRAQGLGEVLAHHVALARPERLIVLGSSILPLLGHDPAQIAKTSLAFNHENYSVPILGALDLGTLAARPARKANFWQRWLDFAGPGFSGSEQDGRD